MQSCFMAESTDFSCLKAYDAGTLESMTIACDIKLGTWGNIFLTTSNVF